MLGPTGHRVRMNVKAARARRDLTVRELSSRLQALGQPIAPPELSRLESGLRRIHMDELLALALALNVRVPDLLDEPDAGPGEAVNLTRESSMEAEQYRRWAGIRDRLIARTVTESAGLSDAVRVELQRAATVVREPVDDSELGGES